MSPRPPLPKTAKSLQEDIDTAWKELKDCQEILEGLQNELRGLQRELSDLEARTDTLEHLGAQPLHQG